MSARLTLLLQQAQRRLCCACVSIASGKSGPPPWAGAAFAANSVMPSGAAAIWFTMVDIEDAFTHVDRYAAAERERHLEGGARR